MGRDQEAVQNLSGFGNSPAAAAQLSTVIERLFQYCERAVDGLTVAQLRDSAGERVNPPGFDVPK